MEMKRVGGMCGVSRMDRGRKQDVRLTAGACEKICD